MIVTGNAGRAGDILLIFEVRSQVHRLAAELIAESSKESLPEPVKPVGARGESQRVGRIQKAEDVGIILARVLKCEVSENLILAIDVLAQTGLQAVLMGGAH